MFALFFAIFIGVFGSTALATPANQTVPPPTATAANTPVPTATANQNNNDNDNNDNNDSPPPPTATPTPEGLMATVTVVRLNVRQGPGTTYDVLGVVASGQTLRVLARNEAGDWWQICCLPGSNRSGWVASQFLQANFDLGQANTLIPLADDLPTPPEPTPIPTADPFGATAPTDTILFQMQQDPLYTWQGQEVSIVYLIANTTENPAVNLELRNEFSNQLRFVAIEDAGGGTALTETTDLSNTIISVTWPELTIDAETEVRVRVQVANDIPDGGVIDNLAVIVADNITAITAGISIGMPPTTLPDFR
ncbi:MAG: SH3 domain-containing protein [Caldilineaceae bacterium]